MAVLPWAILAALGWAGFSICIFILRDGRRLHIMMVPSGTAVGHSAETSHAGSFSVGVGGQITKAYSENIAREQMSQTGAASATQIEREIPDEMHELAALADPLIEGYETVKQDGEWKRHQVYAALVKKANLKDEKWKAAFAIELAIAQRRMNA